MTRWRRRGLLFGVRPGHPWWTSHAQLPTVLPLGEGLWRIYFAARDRDNRSRALAIDVDPSDGMRVIGEHLEPLLELGPPGSFDHMGTGPTCALVVDGQVRLYYFGVSLRPDVRATAAVGVAVSEDGLNFRRAFDGPVFALGPLDPLFSSSAFVRAALGGFRMWYIGGSEWRRAGERLEPIYGIRTTTSDDGFFWNTRTELAVPLDDSTAEAGVGRPWILPTPSGGRLWLSRRGEAFRSGGTGAYRLVEQPIGEDGHASGPPAAVEFENPSRPGDFDSWMQAYACVVPWGDDLVMFYNGDDFGRMGFGWASLAGGSSRGDAR